MPSVGAAVSVEMGTDWSLASVAAGIGVPAGGDAWSTVEPEPEPPPATLTMTSTATMITTSAMARIPYVRVRPRRASRAACCLAAWRSANRWLDADFFLVSVEGFPFDDRDRGRLFGMTTLLCERTGRHRVRGDHALLTTVARALQHAM